MKSCLSFIRQTFKVLSLGLLLFFSVPVLSQESILSASNNVTGDGGTVTYSVGQVAFRTAEAASGTITEGVQQPYEILFMSGTEDGKVRSIDCSVYPNPVISEVTLKIDRPSFDQLNYQLINNNGLIIKTIKIENTETTIPMHELPAGVYLLSVLENNSNLGTWKIIKK